MVQPSPRVLFESSSISCFCFRACGGQTAWSDWDWAQHSWGSRFGCLFLSRHVLVQAVGPPALPILVRVDLWLFKPSQLKQISGVVVISLKSPWEHSGSSGDNGDGSSTMGGRGRRETLIEADLAALPTPRSCEELILAPRVGLEPGWERSRPLFSLLPLVLRRRLPVALPSLMGTS